MHRIKTPLALLLCLGALAILSASASAITLKHHVVIPHGVTHRAEAHRIVSWHVGMDSDHDGIWNGPDDCAHQDGPRSNGGCKPEPVITSYSETTPALTGTSLPATTDGSCGGITPYYGVGQCWAIPYEIVSCESGGSLTAENSDSGAYGAYQLLGHGEYEGMSKEEQDAMAADVWAGGAGRDAWVC